MRGTVPEQICDYQRRDARVPDAAFRSVAALSLRPQAYAHGASAVSTGGDTGAGGRSSRSASDRDDGTGGCTGIKPRSGDYEELQLLLELFSQMRLGFSGRLGTAPRAGSDFVRNGRLRFLLSPVSKSRPGAPAACEVVLCYKTRPCSTRFELCAEGKLIFILLNCRNLEA